MLGGYEFVPHFEDDSVPLTSIFVGAGTAAAAPVAGKAIAPMPPLLHTLLPDPPLVDSLHLRAASPPRPPPTPGDDFLRTLRLGGEGYGSLLRGLGYDDPGDLVGVSRDDLVRMGFPPGHAQRIVNACSLGGASPLPTVSARSPPYHTPQAHQHHSRHLSPVASVQPLPLPSPPRLPRPAAPELVAAPTDPTPVADRRALYDSSAAAIHSALLARPVDEAAIIDTVNAFTKDEDWRGTCSVFARQGWGTLYKVLRDAVCMNALFTIRSKLHSIGVVVQEWQGIGSGTNTGGGSGHGASALSRVSSQAAVRTPASEAPLSAAASAAELPVPLKTQSSVKLHSSGASAGADVGYAAADAAKVLYRAMKGWGTDEDAIYKVMQDVPSQRSWSAVNAAFRAGYPSFHDGDLIAAMRDDLTANEMKKCEGILQERGITLVAASRQGSSRRSSVADRVALAQLDRTHSTTVVTAERTEEQSIAHAQSVLSIRSDGAGRDLKAENERLTLHLAASQEQAMRWEEQYKTLCDVADGAVPTDLSDTVSDLRVENRELKRLLSSSQQGLAAAKCGVTDLSTQSQSFAMASSKIAELTEELEGQRQENTQLRVAVADKDAELECMREKLETVTALLDDEMAQKTVLAHRVQKLQAAATGRTVHDDVHDEQLARDTINQLAAGQNLHPSRNASDSSVSRASSRPAAVLEPADCAVFSADPTPASLQGSFRSQQLDEQPTFEEPHEEPPLSRRSTSHAVEDTTPASLQGRIRSQQLGEQPPLSRHSSVHSQQPPLSRHSSKRSAAEEPAPASLHESVRSQQHDGQPTPSRHSSVHSQQQIKPPSRHSSKRSAAAEEPAAVSRRSSARSQQLDEQPPHSRHSSVHSQQQDQPQLSRHSSKRSAAAEEPAPTSQKSGILQLDDQPPLSRHSSQRDEGVVVGAADGSGNEPSEIAEALYAVLATPDEDAVCAELGRVETTAAWGAVVESFKQGHLDFHRGCVIRAIREELSEDGVARCRATLAANGVRMFSDTPDDDDGEAVLGQPTKPVGDIVDGLYKAMKGFGTNEAAVYQNLSHIDSQEKWLEVQQMFAQKHFDMPSLNALLQDEMTVRELAVCESILLQRGADLHAAPDGGAEPTPESIAAGLHNAMKGFGTDEDAVYAHLRNVTSTELWHDVMTVFRDLYPDFNRGSVVYSLRDEMSPAELARCKELLLANGVSMYGPPVEDDETEEGEAPTAVAGRLHKAMKGWGTDEDAVYAALDSVTSLEHWWAVQDAFATGYPAFNKGDLVASLEDELNTKEMQRAEDILQAHGVGMRSPRPEAPVDGDIGARGMDGEDNAPPPAADVPDGPSPPDDEAEGTTPIRTQTALDFHLHAFGKTFGCDVPIFILLEDADSVWEALCGAYADHGAVMQDWAHPPYVGPARFAIQTFYAKHFPEGMDNIDGILGGILNGATLDGVMVQLCEKYDPTGLQARWLGDFPSALRDDDNVRFILDEFDRKYPESGSEHEASRVLTGQDTLEAVLGRLCAHFGADPAEWTGRLPIPCVVGAVECFLKDFDPDNCDQAARIVEDVVGQKRSFQQLFEQLCESYANADPKMWLEPWPLAMQPADGLAATTIPEEKMQELDRFAHHFQELLREEGIDIIPVLQTAANDGQPLEMTLRQLYVQFGIRYEEYWEFESQFRFQKDERFNDYCVLINNLMHSFNEPEDPDAVQKFATIGLQRGEQEMWAHVYETFNQDQEMSPPPASTLPGSPTDEYFNLRFVFWSMYMMYSPDDASKAEALAMQSMESLAMGTEMHNGFINAIMDQYADPAEADAWIIQDLTVLPLGALRYFFHQLLTQYDPAALENGAAEDYAQQVAVGPEQVTKDDLVRHLCQQWAEQGLEALPGMWETGFPLALRQGW
eukprot:TRINITY_DN4386_c1_g1_i3.p1 TRINITY_DN4386_c1_g1~~TRINITY_DN4386_c1_g1_i3.p1  ORF type:complete len:1888 (+),score=458.74 TRINITY_DN4386_c1_g1_i3:45-5708(+)